MVDKNKDKIKLVQSSQHLNQDMSDLLNTMQEVLSEIADEHKEEGNDFTPGFK